MQKKSEPLQTYTFDCGCSFDVVGPPDASGVPLLDMTGKPRRDCPRVWDMLSAGHTCGVFQLESPLGKNWAKKLSPRTIDHLAALTALLRPGTLNAKDEAGISMTEHYALRKNGKEECTPIHPAIKSQLEDTYQVLTYQEQSIRIVSDIGGFTEEEADILRRCVTDDTQFISMKRGWVSIKELLSTGYNDELFLTMDENGQKSWKKIKNIWSTGVQGAGKVISKNGFYVNSSKYHQFLTNNGWKAKCRLNTNQDFLVTCNHIDFDGDSSFNSDLAIVIAGLVTEGYFVEHASRFTNFDKEMMSTFVKAFESYFGKTIRTDDKVAYINKPERELISKYMGYGLSKDKCFPVEMMRADKETMRKFLSFALAAEGGVCKSGAFEFSSKSKLFAMQIKQCLLRYGVMCNLRECTRKGYGIFYRLNISDKFYQQKMVDELTCLWPSSKKDEMKKVLSKKKNKGFSSRVVPKNIVDLFRNQFPVGIVSDSGNRIEMKKFKTTTLDKFSDVVKSQNNFKWNSFIDGSHSFENFSIADPVENVETFDFQMEDETCPYIIANGIVIHNSMGKKDSKLMEACAVKFVEGAVKKGYPKDDAEFIFSLIRAGERYSFNRCVSGNTIIKRYNTGHKETVKSMYERVKSWPTRYYGYSYSIRGGKLVRNLIKDIYYQGQQELFRVTLEDGRYIDVTVNHSFPTQDGSKLTLRDLAPGDMLPTFAVANKPAAWVQIKSIESIGVGEVYDVEMQAPNHTFVIDNGIITCNSHSYGYGETSYETAYLKAHFPQKFFRAALTIARTSGFWQEKIRDLLNDAISLGVDVRCPDITLRKRNFYTDGKTVWYGINAIKGVGSSSTHKLMDTIKGAIKKYGPLTEWTWPQLLFRVLCGLGKTTVEALIHSGACDAYNVGRVKMQYEYMKVHSLLNRFKDVVYPCNVDEPHVYSVLESMKTLPEVAKTKVRIAAFDETIESLKNPSISFADTLQLKHSYEQYYLSVPLTVSSLDCAANRRISSGRKFTCRDISSSKKIEKPVEMIAVVKEVKVFKVKKGKNEGREMGSLRISDNTGDAKLVMFADSWSTLSDKIKTNSVYYFTIGQFEDAYTIKDVEEYIGSAEEVKIKEALENVDYAPLR